MSEDVWLPAPRITIVTRVKCLLGRHDAIDVGNDFWQCLRCLRIGTANDKERPQPEG